MYPVFCQSDTQIHDLDSYKVVYYLLCYWKKGTVENNMKCEIGRGFYEGMWKSLEFPPILNKWMWDLGSDLESSCINQWNEILGVRSKELVDSLLSIGHWFEKGAKCSPRILPRSKFVTGTFQMIWSRMHLFKTFSLRPTFHPENWDMRWVTTTTTTKTIPYSNIKE